MALNPVSPATFVFVIGVGGGLGAFVAVPCAATTRRPPAASPQA
jgi:hypothetical protein